MKTSACTLVLLFFSVCFVKAQINVTHNGIRTGDEIIKQQVEYVDQGKAGKNQTWDFSKLKTVNDAYSLTYDLPPLQGDSLYIMGDRSFLKRDVADNELIVGTEHNTMYFYRLKNDSLYLLGHENPAVRLTYTQPILHSVYPLNYGNHTQAGYISEGLYSGTVDLATKGYVKVEADAFGKMILPAGDTLNPVLRIKTTKLILDRDIKDIKNIKNDQNNDLPNETSITIPSKGKQMETCQWYTKGYRYPIFETIRNVNLDDNTEIFSTAFYYPLQEHYYLDTDPENMAILDSLWNVETEDNERKTKASNLNTAENTIKEKGYRIYPNPVKDMLYVEYTIDDSPQPQSVSILLYTMDGRVIKNISKKDQEQGKYTERIDCSNLTAGSYVIKLVTRNKVIVSEKILKK